MDNLRPGSREMERCRWEGHNFQSLKEVQCLKKKKKEEGMYCNAVKDEISFTLLHKIIINPHEDGSNKPKHVAESSKLINFLKSCVRLYFITLFN